MTHQPPHRKLTTALPFLIIFGLLLYLTPTTAAGTLSCSITSSASCTATVIYRLSNTSNAHAELPSQSNPAYNSTVVCCTNVIGLSNSCAGTASTTIKLSSSTNAHAEQKTFSNYPDNACISVPAGGSVSTGYQVSNCTGFDTILGSMESATNTHLGDVNAYPIKICATALGVPQTISFSISDNTIGFGTVSSLQTRYASGDTLGTTTDTSDAHTISIASNATSGYSMTISGTTLTDNSKTISPTGSTAVVPAIGTEQFGVRLTINSGTGSTSSPYSGVTWALDTAAFPDLIATGLGDSVVTIFGARYMNNIATLSKAGRYTATITYTVTATF